MTKEQLVQKMILLFEEMEALFEPIATLNFSLDEKYQEKNSFFEKWYKFFNETIKFLNNPEVGLQLIEFGGEKNSKAFIANFIYYRDLLVNVEKNKLNKLQFADDSKFSEAAEKYLEKCQNIFFINFKEFVNAGKKFFLQNQSKEDHVYENSKGEPELASLSLVEPDSPVLSSFSSTSSEKENAAEHSNKISNGFRNQIEKILKEHEKYLLSFNLDRQSSHSRFYLVTKRGAISNLLFIIKHNTLGDFKSCLDGWRTTLQEHRDRTFTKTLGIFFKRHSKTKGSLLFEKLDSLIKQAQLAALQPNL